MAVSIAEFLINRPIRSVLDVGCGEAPWFPILRRMRPDARYVGIDSSEYVVERYGATRNIRFGTLAYIEAFTTEDTMTGDRVGWHERSAAEYRRLFRRAGLTQCGPYCFTDLDELDALTTFERM
jgi:SAM-dependent methyltransferase